MKRYIFAILSIALLATVPFRTAADHEIVQADLVIENIRVFTADKADEKVEAIAVKKGKFVYVGDRDGVQAFKGPKTKVLLLDGQLLLPGFIDGHNYAYLKADELFSLDLSEYSTFEQYKKAILSYRAKHPRLKQVRAFGWNQDVTAEASHKSGQTPRKLIDQLVPDIPFIAFSNDRDELWVNSKALEFSVLNKNADRAEEINRTETGEASGIVRGKAMDIVVQALPQPDFTVEQYKKALRAFQKEAAANGITAAFVPFRYNSENLLQAFDELDRENQLTLTYELGLYVDPDKGPEQIEILKKWRETYQGRHYSIQTAKIYSTRNAFEESFAWEEDKFRNVLELLEREGFRIHVQAMGGLDEIFEGFEYIRARNGKSNFRHTVSHMSFVTREDLAAFRKLRLIPSVKPSALYDTMGVNEEAEALKNLNRMKSYFARGLPVSSSSDYPFGPMNPLYGIETGITRLHPEDGNDLKPLWPKEKATLRQMLRSYTVYAARQIGKEELIGKIQIGKQADFVILDKNLFNIAPSEISEAKVVLTYFKGKEVYRDGAQID
ncbi:amidohydrolase [Ureibacillus sp. FSL K6-8385]|uniref:amidohydrolase n=1 Tax=Ureibacillus sp. FSL K6-8385 TaxID=2954684 RepID=UPI0031593D7C